MGWNLRRSLRLGPLRINLSKTGVGYSVGVRGFRVGRDATGKQYTYTSIPGTGIYRKDYFGTNNAGHPVTQGNPAPALPNATHPGFKTPAWLGRLAVSAALAAIIYLLIKAFA